MRVVGGEHELCPLRVGFLVHEQAHNGTRQHRVKLGIKFVDEEHTAMEEGVEEKSRKTDNL